MKAADPSILKQRDGDPLLKIYLCGLHAVYSTADLENDISRFARNRLYDIIDVAAILSLDSDGVEKKKKRKKTKMSQADYLIIFSTGYDGTTDVAERVVIIVRF